MKFEKNFANNFKNQEQENEEVLVEDKNKTSTKKVIKFNLKKHEEKNKESIKSREMIELRKKEYEADLNKFNKTVESLNAFKFKVILGLEAPDIDFSGAFTAELKNVLHKCEDLAEERKGLKFSKETIDEDAGKAVSIKKSLNNNAFAYREMAANYLRKKYEDLVEAGHEVIGG